MFSGYLVQEVEGTPQVPFCQPAITANEARHYGLVLELSRVCFEEHTLVE